MEQNDGSVMEYYRYTPYGVPGAIRPNGTSVAPGSELTNLLYTGQRWDAVTQLHDYHARLYDPFIARFLTIDPVREGYNPYAYVGWNPTNRIDPSGLVTCVIQNGDLGIGFQCGGYVGTVGGVDVYRYVYTPVSPFLFGGVVATSLPAALTILGALGIVAFALKTQQGQEAAGSLASALTGTLLNEKTDGNDSGSDGSEGAAGRSIDNPSSLEGATPEEVEQAAREAGFVERGDPPRNDPNGARLRKPGNPADQVRIQSGNPADPNAVKQGALCKGLAGRCCLKSNSFGWEPDAAVRLREEPRMNLQEVANILLSSACEDRFGLYEAIWELNGRFPDESLGNKYNVATAALTNLFEHEWIRFERVKGGQEPEALSPELVRGVLSNPVSWYPEYQGTSICFVATETGRSKYFGASKR